MKDDQGSFEKIFEIAANGENAAKPNYEALLYKLCALLIFYFSQRTRNMTVANVLEEQITGMLADILKDTRY